MPHRPRFERVPPVLGIKLTPRDLEILSQISRHRFLNSHQIRQLVGGSAQHVLRRLQRLFHHGYLDRPHAQIRYFSETGSAPLVYALGPAGARVLHDPANPRPRSRHDNRNLKQLYLQHTVLVAEVTLAFQTACRAPDAPRLLLEDDIAPDPTARAALHWAVNIRRGAESKRVGVLPDRILLLQSPATGERTLYFIEADRATMPVNRRSLQQSSLIRKLLAYEATWMQDVPRTRFNCARVRVLIVTSSDERATHVAATCAELKHGRGLFLVTDAATVREHSTSDRRKTIFDLPWLNARGEDERIALP